MSIRRHRLARRRTARHHDAESPPPAIRARTRISDGTRVSASRALQVAASRYAVIDECYRYLHSRDDYRYALVFSARADDSSNRSPAYLSYEMAAELLH